MQVGLLPRQRPARRGATAPYDYVTVNVFESVAHTDRDPLARFREVHPDRNVPEIMREIAAARERAASSGTAWITPNEPANPSDADPS